MNCESLRTWSYSEINLTESHQFSDWLSYKLYDDSELTIETSLSISKKVATSHKWINIKCDWRVYSYEDTSKLQNCQILINDSTELREVRSWTVNYYKWMIINCY